MRMRELRPTNRTEGHCLLRAPIIYGEPQTYYFESAITGPQRRSVPVMRRHLTVLQFLLALNQI